MYTDVLQEDIAEEMSRERRRKAIAAMTDALPTEDIELINAKFPRLAECALFELLNPEETKTSA